MPTFVTERHHAANVFLSHYHYRTQPCNPFKLDWKRRQVTPFADMSPSEMQFLWKTKDLVEKRRGFIFMRFRESWTDMCKATCFKRQKKTTSTKTRCTLSLRCSRTTGNLERALLISMMALSTTYLFGITVN